MCGIAGQFLYKAQIPPRNNLEIMGDVMRSRGPDDEGYFLDQHIGLVHRRLSIRDLSKAGRCPMENKDGSIQVLLNGEIYNWRELRKTLETIGCHFKTRSDTEVIVNGYEVWKEAIVSKLTGMFSLAIWDKKTKQLLLARDRIGEKPLFYMQTNEGLIFASNIDAIASIVEQKIIDPVAIACYLSHSFIPSRCTVWCGVSVLQPAHVLRISPDRNIDVSRYWEMPRAIPLKQRFKDAADRIQQTIDESVRLCLDADAPVGVFLSGGVDSSLIAAMAVRHKSDIPSFTLGFKETTHSEVPFAEKVARHLGIHHHVIEISVDDVLSSLPRLVREYGQPFGDASAVPTYFISKLARKYVKLCLSGDGGDEIFGGYWRVQAGVYAERYGKFIPRRIRRDLVPFLANHLGVIGKRWWAMNALSLSEPGCGYTNSLSWWNHLNDIAGPNLASSLSVDLASFRVGNGGDKREASVIQQLLLDDIEVQLPDAYLTKVDVASMAASLEIRSPYLEKNVIETAWLLPDRFKLHYCERKWLLKKIASRLVPREVIFRKKMGFAMPLAKWFREELGDYLDSLLTNSVADAAGWIRANSVKKHLKEHRNGEDNQTRLWLALWLELWFRYIENFDIENIQNNCGVPLAGLQRFEGSGFVKRR